MGVWVNGVEVVDHRRLGHRVAGRERFILRRGHSTRAWSWRPNSESLGRTVTLGSHPSLACRASKASTTRQRNDTTPTRSPRVPTTPTTSSPATPAASLADRSTLHHHSASATAGGGGPEHAPGPRRSNPNSPCPSDSAASATRSGRHSQQSGDQHRNRARCGHRRQRQGPVEVERVLRRRGNHV